MSRTAYLVALAVLVVNDHILKLAYPSWITGKLSDVAGLFVLAVFLAWMVPRRIACIAAAAMFVWWKSPLSEPFLRALPYEAARVVDWSDLWALLVLPFAYRASTPAPLPRRAHAAVALLSVVALVATSPARSDITIPEGDELRHFATGMTLSEFAAHGKACGVSISPLKDRIEVGVSWRRFHLFPHDRQAFAIGTADVVNGTVYLHFTRIRVVWDANPDAAAYRSDLAHRLRDCLRR